MARKRKLKGIQVIGKRWFQKVYGNTYHSCKVLVSYDGFSWEEIGYCPFTYGYGSQYLQSAIKLLDKAGLIPDIKYQEHGGYEQLWSYIRDRKIMFIDTVHDVNTKKEL